MVDDFRWTGDDEREKLIQRVICITTAGTEESLSGSVSGCGGEHSKGDHELTGKQSTDLDLDGSFGQQNRLGEVSSGRRSFFSHVVPGCGQSTAGAHQDRVSKQKDTLMIQLSWGEDPLRRSW